MRSSGSSRIARRCPARSRCTVRQESGRRRCGRQGSTLQSRVATGCSSAGHRRPRRGSRTPGSPTSFATSWTTFCPSCRRFSGVRSRSRCLLGESEIAGRRARGRGRVPRGAAIARRRPPSLRRRRRPPVARRGVARSAPLRAGPPGRRGGCRVPHRFAGTPPAVASPHGARDTARRCSRSAGSASAPRTSCFTARLGTTFPRPTLIRLWETSGGQSVLRARARRRAPTTRQHALAGRPATDSLDPGGAPGRARRRPRSRPQSRCPVSVAAVAEPTVDLVEAARRIAGRDRARRGARRPGSSSSTTNGCGSRTPCLPPPSWHARHLHADAPSTPASQRSSPARRNARDTSPSRRPSPSPPIASILEEAARVGARAWRPGDGRRAGGAGTPAHPAGRRRGRTTAGPSRRRQAPRRGRHRPGGRNCSRERESEPRQASSGPTILVQLAEVEGRLRGAPSPHYREALAEAEGDDALEATIHLGLANLMNYHGGVERGLAHSELGRPGRCADHRHRPQVQRPRVPRGLALSAPAEACRVPRWTRRSRSNARFRTRPFAGGPFLRLLPSAGVGGRARSRHEGCSSSSSTPPGEDRTPQWRRSRSGSLGFLEWRAGNWAEADRHAAGGIELLTQLGRVDPPAEFPGRDHRRPPRPDRRGARPGKRRGGPGRGRADRGSGSPATAGCSASSSSRWATRRGRSSISGDRSSSATPSCASPGCASSWETCSRH